MAEPASGNEHGERRLTKSLPGREGAEYCVNWSETHFTQSFQDFRFSPPREFAPSIFPSASYLVAKSKTPTKPTLIPLDFKGTW